MICARQVQLNFIGQLLRYLADRNFCDIFRRHVILTFVLDLLTHKVSCRWPVDHLCQFDLDLLTHKVSCRWPVDHLCQFASKLVPSFSKYHVLKFGSGRTNKRTNGEVENIMPPPAGLA